MPELSGNHVVNVASRKRCEKFLAGTRLRVDRHKDGIPVLPLWTTATIRRPSGDHEGPQKKAGTKNSGGLAIAITRRLLPSTSAVTREVVPGSGTRPDRTPFAFRRAKS